MKKNALIETLRRALDDALTRGAALEAAQQRADLAVRTAEAKLRRLEEQCVPIVPPRIPTEHSIQLEDSRYRPARAGETPDIQVTDLRPGHEAARDLPYVRI